MLKNPFANKILFLQVLNKDPEAYGKFYDLYIDRIYRFIFFKVNAEHEAQDLTSEVFLRLWQCIRDEKDIKNLNAFIYTIARNSVIDHYRKRSQKQEREAPLEAGYESLAGSLEQEHLIKSDTETVLAGLDKLKDEYREVVILKYLDELSIKEIAEVTRKSSGSVRVILHRAVKALRENIDQYIK